MPYRYFIRLSYRGAQFHGWQIQPNAVTVQQKIQEALAMVLRNPEVKITGAGRTDTGVNAYMMIAHFDNDEKLEGLDRMVKKLNSILWKDIVIHTLFPVTPEAHARFDATSRTYKYFANTEKSPFSYPLSWYTHMELDFALMNMAAKKLYEYTDFTSFSKLHTDVATNDCKITYAKWNKEGDQWVFTITADRFLRNMVRAIVGTLVEVGKHKMTIEQFCKVIEHKNRCVAGTSMPGHALFLWEITYPFPIQ